MLSSRLRRWVSDLVRSLVWNTRGSKRSLVGSNPTHGAMKCARCEEEAEQLNDKGVCLDCTNGPTTFFG
jgi:hypothetical protein